jgi:hypothetical protein
MFVVAQKSHLIEIFIRGTSMKLLSIHPLNLVATVEQLGPRLGPRPASNQTHHSADLLQRTQVSSNDQTPDARYWTEYDHFMLEREARARRREYVYGLIAKAWRRGVERLARGQKLTPAEGRRGN